MTKTILISGGTSGIGKASTIQLLEEGHNVAAFSNSEDKVNALNEELRKEFSEDNFLVLQGDVTSSDSLEKIVKQTLDKFKKIDVLFNNAGFGFFVEADEVNIEDYQKMIDVNVTGIARLTKIVLPHMKANKSGLILNTASVAGKRAMPKAEFYSATKFAVMGYSEGLRKELVEHGIKVSTLCPGMISTPFFTEEELERRTKERGDGSPLSMLDVSDVSRVVSLIVNQSEKSDIQDILVMPFGQ